MSSTTYTVDLDDIRFVLFDQLKLHERTAKIERYEDLDRDIYDATIEELGKLATEVVAPINGPGDRTGCVFDGEGGVKTPEGYNAAWKAFCEGGWVGPRADPELGGAAMPAPIGAVMNEVISGACMAFMMYPGLSSAAARVIARFGPESFRKQVAERLFRGKWGGTMCLTEAGAGSSVGDNRCRATPTDEEGVFMLEGEKIFITGGDQDMTDNVCHLVLARTEDAPAGIKGLSLFLVSKYHFDHETLDLGERNGAHVLGIEHKMGINGSATCTVGFGTKGPCRAYLVGKEREGIAVMFHMMNEARLGVGLQGLAAGSASYQYALHYANERVQGTRIADIKDAEAERVAIVRHPDVRRMLMSQKVLVETMRSMAYRLALDFDISEYTADEEQARKLRERVDLLVPIVKATCTDLGFDVAVTGVQIFGGYGFTQEFPVEQLVRDAKIQSIYEGTNGIQALDLLGRKMRVGGGRLFMEWMSDAQADCKAATEEGFGDAAKGIEKAIGALGGAAMHLAGVGGQGKVDAAMLYAVPFMKAFGYVVLVLEALDQARVAKRMIDDSGETPRLKGKLLNLQFAVAQLLPQTVALAKTIGSGDESCLDEALFQV